LPPPCGSQTAVCDVVLHEATSEAGGRCRSYHDAALGTTIDNGNHLLLSGNSQSMAYVHAIGADDQLVGPEEPAFDFIDLAASERWRLRLNEGRLPWWILEPPAGASRVPGHRNYAERVPRLFFAGPKAAIGHSMACAGRVFDRLWHPLLLAALNTEPAEASASLAGRRSCARLVARGDNSAARSSQPTAFLALLSTRR